MLGIWWMNYNIFVTRSFAKELKRLSKKYKNIKSDYKILLKNISSKYPSDIAVELGNNCYKYRLKNSDNHKGKSAGYRVVYYFLHKDDNIVLLTIYSKSDYENISDKELDKKISEALTMLGENQND